VEVVNEEGHMAESYTGEAYCVKCKEKREFTGHVEETNGRRFAKGICPTCGTKVTRILGKA
jgi:Zn finger protein HypA/HybF involved in hydrogenase expression